MKEESATLFYLSSSHNSDSHWKIAYTRSSVHQIQRKYSAATSNNFLHHNGFGRPIFFCGKRHQSKYNSGNPVINFNTLLQSVSTCFSVTYKIFEFTVIPVISAFLYSQIISLTN